MTMVPFFFLKIKLIMYPKLHGGYGAKFVDLYYEGTIDADSYVDLKVFNGNNNFLFSGEEATYAIKLIVSAHRMTTGFSTTFTNIHVVTLNNTIDTLDYNHVDQFGYSGIVDITYDDKSLIVRISDSVSTTDTIKAHGSMWICKSNFTLPQTGYTI